MSERLYLSWYCDNDRHFQCQPYHPRSLGRCECQCHDDPGAGTPVGGGVASTDHPRPAPTTHIDGSACADDPQQFDGR